MVIGESIKMGTSKIREKNKGGGSKCLDKNPVVLNPTLDDVGQIDPSSVELFQNIFNSDSLTSQIENIRTLIKTVASEKYQIVAIVSVQWFFNSDYSCGIKKVISNCLNQIKDDEFSGLLAEQISSQIHKQIGYINISGDECRMTIIKNILSMFDNFKLGEKAVLADRCREIVEFILQTLEFQMENICEEDVTAVEKQKMIDEAGDSVRVLVHLVRNNLDHPEILEG